MAITYLNLTGIGAPPSPLDVNALDIWNRKLLNARYSYCNVPRGTYYYFSQSTGNDSNPGTASLPFKTRAKAQAIHDAISGSMGNVAFLFKAGDEWNESGEVVMTKKFMYVGAYGTGPKPFWNRFITKYNQSGWTLDSGDRYKRTYVGDIAWIRDQTSRLTAYTRVSSTALVTSTPLSFWFDPSTPGGGTGTLYINCGTGINPNMLNLEVVDSNTENGIQLVGDGCLSENIRSEGWGIHRTNTATQKHAYVSSASGTDAVTFKNMEGYYGSSHVATHFLSGGAAGGIATFIECKAGYTSYNPLGESIFNAYSSSGLQEVVFHNCELTYGTLPSTEWVTSLALNRGFALYAHTDGFVKASLIINNGMTIKANKWGCEIPTSSLGDLPIANNLSDVRGFVIREVYEENEAGGDGTPIAPPNMVQIGCAYYLKPKNNASVAALVNTQPNGWSINSLLQLDLTHITEVLYGVWNTSGTQSTPTLYNFHLNLKNASTLTTGFSMEVLNVFSPNNYLSGGKLVNSIVAASNFTGGSIAYLGFNNNTNSHHNAFFGLNNGSVNVNANYGNQTNTVNLTDLPIVFEPAYFNSEIYHTGTALGINLDANLTPNSLTNPSIGPVDERPSPIGLNFHSLKLSDNFVETNAVGWEIPIGLVNSSNTTFTSTREPRIVFTEQGGMVSGHGYSYSGGVISMTLAPQDFIIICY